MCIRDSTGTVPEMRPVENWYFDLPAFGDFLRERVAAMEADPNIRAIVPQAIKEFLAPPVVYIKNDAREAYEAVAADLPAHELREPDKGKQSFEIEFADIDARDAARDVQMCIRDRPRVAPRRAVGEDVYLHECPFAMEGAA